jgi:superfamily II DNA or RNA helicase
MQLRPYQSAAVHAIFEAWDTTSATLMVMPTGVGKTVVFAHVLDRLPPGSRAMVVAHREELIWQASDKIEAVTGHKPDVEMADMRAANTLYGKSRFVVSTVQSQVAGCQGAGRMSRFDPAEFSVLVVDEAHHATSPTYQRVINHYRQNPNLKVLGVTATPDRHDEAALGQIFESVAYDYEILDAINDGWLAPIRQRAVAVHDLDLSAVRTTAGDLNGADLARVLEHEVDLHGIVGPSIELAAGRKTLMFAASIAQADTMCEICNRHQADSARFVHGKTPKEERRQMLADYAAGRFQFLVNVGVATEGFDDPSIVCVVMARPTKSRALYTQMAGRGTRPLPGIVDPHELTADRRAAIAASAKPCAEIIDFVGNSGKHRLISTADILGGKYADEVVERARKMAEDADGQAVDMAETLFDAEKEIAEQHERERRAKIRIAARYKTQEIDPFDVLHIEPQRERGWDTGRQLSPKMIALLQRQGIDTGNLTFAQGRQLCAEICRRFDEKRCTFKQARLLAKHGYGADVSFTDARRIIDALAANGWRRPAAEPIDIEAIPI